MTTLRILKWSLWELSSDHFKELNPTCLLNLQKKIVTPWETEFWKDSSNLLFPPKHYEKNLWNVPLVIQLMPYKTRKITLYVEECCVDRWLDGKLKKSFCEMQSDKHFFGKMFLEDDGKRNLQCRIYGWRERREKLREHWLKNWRQIEKAFCMYTSRSPQH